MHVEESVVEPSYVDFDGFAKYITLVRFPNVLPGVRQHGVTP